MGYICHKNPRWPPLISIYMCVYISFHSKFLSDCSETIISLHYPTFHISLNIKTWVFDIWIQYGSLKYMAEMFFPETSFWCPWYNMLRNPFGIIDEPLYLYYQYKFIVNSVYTRRNASGDDGWYLIKITLIWPIFRFNLDWFDLYLRFKVSVTVRGVGMFMRLYEKRYKV